MRTTRNGSVSNCGIVIGIDANRPNRVKTDACPQYFRKVLKLITCSSKFMNSSDIQSHSERSISQHF